MLVVALILSGLFLLVIHYCKEHGTRGFYGLSFWLLAVVVFSPVLLLNGLFIFAVGLVCDWRGESRKRCLQGCWGATALAYLVIAILELLTIRSQRQAHPFEPVDQRLAYETPERIRRASAPTGGGDWIQKIKPDPAFVALLDGKKEEVEYRQDALKDLHERLVEIFVDSPGFGVGRVTHVTGVKRIYWREEDEPIPVTPSAANGPEGVAGVSDPPGNPVAPAGPVPEERKLRQLHLDSLIDFLDPERFGYVKDRKRVAGFVPHEFRERPRLAGGEETSAAWRLRNLELVSLLKHAEPVAYVSEHLPRMRELADAQTRPLDEFERRALDALRRGGHLETDSTPERIRLLGAIRAAKQCRSCHQVEEGTLLGAFSYELTRVR